jgi:hypothetical protein
MGNREGRDPRCRLLLSLNCAEPFMAQRISGPGLVLSTLVKPEDLSAVWPQELWSYGISA